MQGFLQENEEIKVQFCGPINKLSHLPRRNLSLLREKGEIVWVLQPFLLGIKAREKNAKLLEKTIKDTIVN